MAMALGDELYWQAPTYSGGEVGLEQVRRQEGRLQREARSGQWQGLPYTTAKAGTSNTRAATQD
jgi:hypothetical protein